MGHPEPFNLKFIGVGNEQWGEAYFERYPVFQKAIKARHPEVSRVFIEIQAADRSEPGLPPEPDVTGPS